MMRHVQHLTGMTTKHNSMKVAASVELTCGVTVDALTEPVSTCKL
jgi:hypothetical protein